MPAIKAGCVCLLLYAAAIGGQQPVLPGDVVIRTTTTLVEVRVAAVDSAGHPMAGLRRENFQIFDNSKPQPLTLFAPSRSGSAPISAGSTATNAPSEVAPTPPGYAMLLIDWINTGYGERLRVQENVLRLLKNYEPRQKLGIYVLSRHSHLLHNFTADREILATLVERMDMDSGPAAAESRIWTSEDFVKETIRVLNLVGVEMLHVPGRKSLIWLTDGFSMMVSGRGLRGNTGPSALFFQDVEKSLAKLNSADVAVYSIDASGIRMTPNIAFDNLREVSLRTGGTSFHDRNDLDEGMRLALEDAAASYTLGFHAPDDARRGLHVISVHVNVPGVKLRYRETYDPGVAGTVRH